MRPVTTPRLHSIFLLIAALLLGREASAHSMPHSVLMLDFKGSYVSAELQWPLKELQLAFPQKAIETGSPSLPDREGPWIDSYLLAHFRIANPDGRPWRIAIRNRRVDSAAQDATGSFRELVFELRLLPPAGSSTRNLVIRYDAIMHQVLSHKMYVSVRQDWDGGQPGADSSDADLGVLQVDQRDNTVPPIVIKLDDGSHWKGFRSMVSLGMSHIAEGTDHLLFLLVLLLPAPLLATGRRWRGGGGIRYSTLRLLRITLAFTLGHSLTLLAGALAWIRVPSQPVEILIAVSILVGAIHALRPLFPGREPLVAGAFGLVHGLAFATTLSGLELDGRRMALSILGFNLGIELMQLFVVLITVPWLIILSGYPSYRWIRVAGAIVAIIAALAWILERCSGRSNGISEHFALLASHGNFVVLAIAIVAIAHYLAGSRARAKA